MSLARSILSARRREGIMCVTSLEAGTGMMERTLLILTHRQSHASARTRSEIVEVEC